MWFKAVFWQEVGVSRRTLTDAHWGRIADLGSGRAGDRGVTGWDKRRFVDAVLWIVRTGAPWRDLPPELGNWNSTWRRFDRWARRGVRDRLFAALAEAPDLEYLIIDATIVRAHQHSAGAIKKAAVATRKPSGAAAAA